MSAKPIQSPRVPQPDEPGLQGPGVVPATLSPRVRQLHDYWQSKRHGRAMPARADIEPVEIKPLLPYLIIADLFADPVRVRFRLAGTKVCEAFGFNIAGRWLQELELSADDAFWIQQYSRVMASHAPVYGRTSGWLGTIELFHADWALFPLSRDGLRVDQCLEIEDWRQGSPIARFDNSAIDWKAFAFE